MEYVDKVEDYVALWYKNLPHIPKNGRQWLSDNIWWVVLIFVVISAFGVFNLLFLVFIGGLLSTALGGAIGAALSGVAVLVAMLTLGLSIINIIIGSLAVGPLKSRRKKGWSLLLLGLIVSAASGVVAILFTSDFISLVRDLLVVAIGGYFLFEIRDYFDTSGASFSKADIPRVPTSKQE